MNNWKKIDERNLLSQDNLALVEKAFHHYGIIFGWHYYYAGGSGRSDFIFSCFKEYLDAVTRSKSGDHFTVYSINDLNHIKLISIGNPTSSEMTIIPLDVLNVLSGLPGLVIVWRRFNKELKCMESVLGTLSEDDSREERKCCLLEYQNRDGEVSFYVEDVLDHNQYNNPVSTVSPSLGQRRIYALIDGKCPNENGETPDFGPY